MLAIELQRAHDRDHVGRTELRLDEADTAARDARLAADVVVVEEEGEQPDVVARGFDLLVGVGADLPRRRPIRPFGMRPPSSSTNLKVSIFCGLPSSVTSKSACFRSAMTAPSRSLAMTSTRTKLMPRGRSAAAVARLAAAGRRVGRARPDSAAGCPRDELRPARRRLTNARHGLFEGRHDSYLRRKSRPAGPTMRLMQTD